ncbi:unnamed protein product, partial [Ascophyllum nodosum]
YTLRKGSKRCRPDVGVRTQPSKHIRVDCVLAQAMKQARLGRKRTQKQLARVVEMDAERDALVALYRATHGNSWGKKKGWCTDAPLSEW